MHAAPSALRQGGTRPLRGASHHRLPTLRGTQRGRPYPGPRPRGAVAQRPGRPHGRGRSRPCPVAHRAGLPRVSRPGRHFASVVAWEGTRRSGQEDVGATRARAASADPANAFGRALGGTHPPSAAEIHLLRQLDRRAAANGHVPCRDTSSSTGRPGTVTKHGPEQGEVAKLGHRAVGTHCLPGLGLVKAVDQARTTTTRYHGTGQQERVASGCHYSSADGLARWTRRSC